ncbi:MAG: aldehyde ferredoxin oxidoreductase family protein [Candidatus Aegiribacteria sp.]|nr:aldehyde ferredoxin oxidoreductase family protein [Candidatus Aegiribacteria sp.]
MTGRWGRILHVDLSSGEYRFEEIDPDICRFWIGGKGLAGYYLFPEITRSWNDPEMPLVFMTGPLTGTLVPASGRICVMSKSPLTGAVGDCSVGGSLGWQIKKSGIDGIVITGRSKRLCGIEIYDGNVSIEDAGWLSGAGTDELFSSLKEKGSVAGTGPAAEHGVLFSSIMVDGTFAAGRGGLGLVSASKNLKYITVRGTGIVPVHDQEKLRSASEDIRRLVAATPAITGEHGLQNCGTAALYDLISCRRMMPTANFRRTCFDPASSMNSHAFSSRYKPKKYGCKSCHILCKRIGEDGTHLPEYETMSHFSALIENDDLRAVTAANMICNETGMDTISAGATLACFSEIVGEKLTPDRIAGLLLDIAFGRGEGSELGQGSYRFGESKGCPDLSMSVKRMELPGYDPRGAYGMALGYVTSTRGACHLRAYPISHEILRKPVATDRFSFAGKARIVKIAEDMNAVIDSLTACKFFFFGCSLEEYASAYSAVTGTETSAQDLLSAGERTYFRERMMNAKCGFTSEDDDLPSRFFSETGSSGDGIDIPPLDRKEFLETRSKYYQVRGLDQKGCPLRSKAEELGLEGLL